MVPAAPLMTIFGTVHCITAGGLSDESALVLDCEDGMEGCASRALAFRFSTRHLSFFKFFVAISQIVDVFGNGVDEHLKIFSVITGNRHSFYIRVAV